MNDDKRLTTVNSTEGVHIYNNNNDDLPVIRSGRTPKYRDRRLGNTTRLIDGVIQLLFSIDSIVLIRDHYKDGQDRYCNRLMFKTILKRLEIEHKLEPNKKDEYSGLTLIANYDNCTLRLTKREE